ncbi:epoxide hydrolase family protein [Actinoplanes derwentensis]|uniref:Pimeloyl-ACP methyl ester carboxylesterase n=1 Tax=Actinoplanes derwentensis TaxID=113562 RepID=A0A1H1ZZW0_9ACTN|nr:epoxide hydrolase family protein [Actinoplanes derwentensis]GID83474.1 microsomal epoxide hydrolase [Actinoplanes derwentensis]SDT38766.1 Pimeloyl-ACP methyl ester carboxylesterase [Actinoplanes derwentensis]
MNDIRVAQSELDDLTDRLARTRWPADAPAGYGITLDRVRALASHWQRFDWRAHEAELNAVPHQSTELDGDRVHFFHTRSTDPHALPLLLTHGWPGSTVEFLDVIGPLSEHFHVVAPAIPGFGLSGPTTRSWGVDRVARAWAALMTELGYPRFGAQGGDWGSGISRSLGTLAPGRVVGVHVNYLPTPGTAENLTPVEEARLAKTMHLAANRHPHQILFAATPQTPAYALTDSPAGLLAFMAEKFDTWADPATPVPDDRIVANVAHHWLFRTAGTAARIVKESTLAGPQPPLPVPLGVAVLPGDIVQSIRPIAARTNDIHHWTEFPRGGHFPALEVPTLFTADVTTFFRTLTGR